MIFIGSDHKGFDLKELIKKEFNHNSIEYVDCGDGEYNPNDDYPDYAFLVGEKVAGENENFGLLICASGEGMTMAANKVKGIRAALCHTTQSAKLSREHNNANILVINSSLSLDEAIELIDVFLETPFSGEERHLRRIKKISDYEKSRS